MERDINKKSRIKHFITFVPLQAPEDLRLVAYRMPSKYSNGRDNITQESRFPMIALMRQLENEGYLFDDNYSNWAQIKVTVIMSIGEPPDADLYKDKNNRVKQNWNNSNISKERTGLLNELKNFGFIEEDERQAEGLDHSRTYKVIRSTYDSSSRSLEDLYRSIQERIQPNSDVYADITFGEKPQTVALYQNLSDIVTDSEDNIVLKSCIYGHYDFIEHGVGEIIELEPFITEGGAITASDEEKIRIGYPENNKEYTKHFISLLPRDKYIQPRLYRASDGTLLHYGNEDSAAIVNPVTLLMYAYTYKDEKIKITLIADDTNSMVPALEKYEEEIEAVKAQNGFTNDELTINSGAVIPTAKIANIESMRTLCKDLCNRINDWEEVFLDITFGAKPDTISIYAAVAEAMLRHGGRSRIEFCSYGYDPHISNVIEGEDNESAEFSNKCNDITLYISRLIADFYLSRMNISNTKSIREIVMFGDDNDEQREQSF